MDQNHLNIHWRDSDRRQLCLCTVLRVPQQDRQTDVLPAVTLQVSLSCLTLINRHIIIIIIIIKYYYIIIKLLREGRPEMNMNLRTVMLRLNLSVLTGCRFWRHRLFWLVFWACRMSHTHLDFLLIAKLKGYSGVSLIHVLTHRDTEWDPPQEIKFSDR